MIITIIIIIINNNDYNNNNNNNKSNNKKVNLINRVNLVYNEIIDIITFFFWFETISYYLYLINIMVLNLYKFNTLLFIEVFIIIILDS